MTIDSSCRGWDDPILHPTGAKLKRVIGSGKKGTFFTM